MTDAGSPGSPESTPRPSRWRVIGTIAAASTVVYVAIQGFIADFTAVFTSIGLLGALAVLLASAGIGWVYWLHKSGRSHELLDRHRRSAEDWKNRAIPVAGIATALVLMTISLQLPAPTSTSSTAGPTTPESGTAAPGTSGRIDEPADNTRVPHIVTATGTVDAFIPGHQLWLFVRCNPLDADNRYYPAPVVQDEHRWQALDTTVGGGDSAGDHCVLSLADLDPAAQTGSAHRRLGLVDGVGRARCLRGGRGRRSRESGRPALWRVVVGSGGRSRPGTDGCPAATRSGSVPLDHYVLRDRQEQTPPPERSTSRRPTG